MILFLYVFIINIFISLKITRVSIILEVFSNETALCLSVLKYFTHTKAVFKETREIVFPLIN